MYRSLALAALAAVPSLASQITVHNHCAFNVKTVPSHEGADESPEFLEPGDKYSAPSEGSAWCLKLYASQGDDAFAQNPTQLEWSTWTPTDGNAILAYDLSNIDMADDTSFLRHGMNLTSADPGCDSKGSPCRPAICKAQGKGKTTPCEDAYNQPFDTRTLSADADYNVDMHLCTENDNVESSDNDGGSPESVARSVSPASDDVAHAPQPATTLATQAVPAPSAAADAEVVTHWVTETISARDAEPEATIAKRYLPPHVHHARHTVGGRS